MISPRLTQQAIPTPAWSAKHRLGRRHRSLVQAEFYFGAFSEGARCLLAHSEQKIMDPELRRQNGRRARRRQDAVEAAACRRNVPGQPRFSPISYAPIALVSVFPRLTFEFASRQIALRMNARSPLPDNKGSNDSDPAWHPKCRITPLEVPQWQIRT
jgi:hypothetical protein